MNCVDEEGAAILVERFGMFKTVKTGDTISDSYYYTRKDGKAFPIFITAAPVIVKSFLDHVGGKIWFESEENKGTTFHVLLPLYPPKQEEQTPKKEEAK